MPSQNPHEGWPPLDPEFRPPTSPTSPVRLRAGPDYVPELAGPEDPNEQATERTRLWGYPRDLTRGNAQKGHAEAHEGVYETLEDLDHVSRPDIETKIEVIKRLPRWRERAVQSKFMQPNWLGGKALGHVVGRDSFTLHEYGHGTPSGDRLSRRYQVVKKKRGYALPYTVGAIPPMSPGARNASTPQSDRGDMLVMSADGQSTWAGALRNRYDRSTVAVGKDIAVIGVDARPLRPPARLQRIGDRILGYLAIDRTLTPNAAGRGMDAVTGIYSTKPEDVDEQTKKLIRIANELRALHVYANFLGLPPSVTNNHTQRNGQPLSMDVPSGMPPDYPTPPKYTLLP
jgi:hypothetical protein